MPVRVFFAALVILLVYSAPLPAQSADPVLQKVISERRQARASKDLATWTRLTADDVVEIHSDSRMHTKVEELAEIQAATPPTIPVTDEKIRMHGPATAVYTSLRNERGGLRRMSQVWVKNANGQWQCVLVQQTIVPAK